MDGSGRPSSAERGKNTEDPVSPSGTKRPAHQRFVVSDPAAFRYLEEDASTTVLERWRRLSGYEVYFVEQWACSRVHPTFVITTYTGLEQHSALVSVLSVPTDEEAWSPRLRIYFKAISKSHARRKETPLGTLMVTNLSGFPSALTVIPVPDGDLKKHREDFFVNENLKRMGCAGRAGLNLSYPVQATEAKFNRLYHTSSRVGLYAAVIELVKLCQAALVLCGKLAPEYADGLLCDVTEEAISQWWNDIGAEVYNVEPSDGILGPTTVAALIGLVLGARNRLHAFGAPVAKDVYDLASTKRGIAYFQKSQRLERTRKLDRRTVESLHRATNKAAKSSEGWNVPRAVKSTMAELSGKGQDLAVGEAREKAGIAEIETLDIETFVQLASGERCKWLWYGKPRKSDADVFKQLGADDGMVFENDENGGHTVYKQPRESLDDDPSRFVNLSERVHTHSSHGSGTNLEGMEKDQALRKAVFKSVTGRMTDARSGFGRIRDAVGMRGHHSRHSKEAASFSDGEILRSRPHRFSDEQARDPTTGAPLSLTTSSVIAPDQSDSATPSSPHSRKGSTVPQKGAGSIVRAENIFDKIAPSDKYAAWEFGVESESEGQPSGNISDNDQVIRGGYRSIPRNNTSEAKAIPQTNGSAAGKDDIKDDLNRVSRRLFTSPQMPNILQRTQSQPAISQSIIQEHYQYRWPRHLSFSVVVDVIAANEDMALDPSGELEARKHADSALAWEQALNQHSQNLNTYLSSLQKGEGTVVDRRVGDIEDIDNARGRDQEVLDA
ncbi:MAG: hypothetical protein Q9174_005328, partial [Haloplaca sp. 1 TL-2023]